MQTWTTPSTRLALGIVAVLSLHACGAGDAPTSPSPPAIAQVGGVWTGTSTLSSVSGGECVGPIYQAVVGVVTRYTFAVTQSGSALTATSTSQTDGSNCAWTGTAGTSTISFNATSCSAGSLVGVRCASGALRDVTLVSDGITATVNGNSATGTGAESANVFVSGTSSGVGILVLTSTFTMSR